jgi:hypothetical protein
MNAAHPGVVACNLSHPVGRFIGRIIINENYFPLYAEKHL